MSTSGSAKKKRPAPGGAAASGPASAAGYFHRSQRPLEILFFLLPLIAFYEIGLILILRSGGTVLTNRAHDALLRVFDVIGLDASRLSLPALSLPGVLLVVILLAWQALSRAKWEVDLRAVALMAIESVLLAIPLFLIVQRVMQAFVHATGLVEPGLPPAIAADGESLRALSFPARVAVSIGAGLYEELIFRMALIAVLHTLFVDVVGWRESRGMVLAVIVAAIAFVAYHPLHDAHGALDWRRVVSLFVIGLWFGAVFAYRGFGIVVGTHAAYDIAALTLE